jgi:hypothetical protein
MEAGSLPQQGRRFSGAYWKVYVADFPMPAVLWVILPEEYVAIGEVRHLAVCAHEPIDPGRKTAETWRKHLGVLTVKNKPSAWIYSEYN